MLVLSRRIGQQIRIGQSVVVTLLQVDRNKARIGIDAPANIPVYRQELLDFDKMRSASGSQAATSQKPAFQDESGPSRAVLRRVAGPRFLWDSAAV